MSLNILNSNKKSSKALDSVNNKSSRKVKIIPQFSISSENKPPLDLLEIQRKSFFDFLQHGIPHELAKIAEFRETRKTSTCKQELELKFNPETYKFISPNFSPKEAILNGKTYACKVYVQATLMIRSPSETQKANTFSGFQKEQSKGLVKRKSDFSNGKNKRLDVNRLLNKTYTNLLKSPFAYHNSLQTLSPFTYSTLRFAKGDAKQTLWYVRSSEAVRALRSWQRRACVADEVHLVASEARHGEAAVTALQAHHHAKLEGIARRLDKLTSSRYSNGRGTGKNYSAKQDVTPRQAPEELPCVAGNGLASKGQLAQQRVRSWGLAELHVRIAKAYLRQCWVPISKTLLKKNVETQEIAATLFAPLKLETFSKSTVSLIINGVNKFFVRDMYVQSKEGKKCDKTFTSSQLCEARRFVQSSKVKPVFRLSPLQALLRLAKEKGEMNVRKRSESEGQRKGLVNWLGDKKKGDFSSDALFRTDSSANSEFSLKQIPSLLFSPESSLGNEALTSASLPVLPVTQDTYHKMLPLSKAFARTKYSFAKGRACEAARLSTVAVQSKHKGQAPDPGGVKGLPGVFGKGLALRSWQQFHYSKEQKRACVADETEGCKNETQIFRPWIFLGELPLMTKRGHFILNGSPRVIVNQIARCPGIYFQEKRRGVGVEQEIRVSADLIPQRGPWLRIQSDWEGRFWARLKQEGRVKYSTLYEAFQDFEKEYNPPLICLLSNSYFSNTNITPLGPSLFSKSENVTFQERKIKEDRQKKALIRLFKNPSRYSLGKLGRSRVNERIHCSFTRSSEALDPLNNTNSNYLASPVPSTCKAKYVELRTKRLASYARHNKARSEDLSASSALRSWQNVTLRQALEGLPYVADKGLASKGQLAQQSTQYPVRSVASEQLLAVQSKHGKGLAKQKGLMGKEACLASLAEGLRGKGSLTNRRNVLEIMYASCIYSSDSDSSINQVQRFTSWLKGKDVPCVAGKQSNKTIPLLASHDKLKGKELRSFFNEELMAKDLDAIHTCLERLLEGQGFTDDIDNLKNRFIRTSGKLLQQQFELGLFRLNEVIMPLLGNLLPDYPKGKDSTLRVKELETGALQDPLSSDSLGNMHVQLHTKRLASYARHSKKRRASHETSCNALLPKDSWQDATLPSASDVRQSSEGLPCFQRTASKGLASKGQLAEQRKVFTSVASCAEQSAEQSSDSDFLLNPLTIPLGYWATKSEAAEVAKLYPLAKLNFGAKQRSCVARAPHSFYITLQSWLKDKMNVHISNTALSLRDFPYVVGWEGAERSYAKQNIFLEKKPSTFRFFRNKVSSSLSFIYPLSSLPILPPFSKAFRLSAGKGACLALLAGSLGLAKRDNPTNSVEKLRGNTKFQDWQSQKTEGENLPSLASPRKFTLSEGSSKEVSIIKNTPFRWLRTSKPINSAFREFFGSNPLSQYMDQTNPLAEITHKRRLSSMGPGGIKRETAGMEVRGIHPTHYGRVCPIETPEGKNAGLVNSPTVYGRVGNYGFLETPLYQVIENQVQTKRWAFFSAQHEEKEKSSLATCDTGLLQFNFLAHLPIPVQTANNPLTHFQQVERYRVGYRSLSPIQTISIATALIPFLEHDDANRALMGSNMQRQAIPLLSPERPIVGTGFEPLVVMESGQALQATKLGCVSQADANSIIVHTRYSMEKSLSQNVLQNSILPWSRALVHRFGIKDIANIGELRTKRLAWHGKEGVTSSMLVLADTCLAQLARRVRSKHGKSKMLLLATQGRPYEACFASQAVGSVASCSATPTLCQLRKAQKYSFAKGKGSKQDATLPFSQLRKASPLPLRGMGSAKQIEDVMPCVAGKGLTSLAQQDVSLPEAGATLQIAGWDHINKEHISSAHNTFLLQPLKQDLQFYERSNQETCLSQRPLVQEGDWIQKGDFLADSSASHSGDLALGKNVTVAYMPWEGYNFEDAIVISDRLVSDDIYTSLHIERYEIKISKNSQGKERITNRVPGTSHSLKHLDNFGIARISSWVQPGDILVGKVVELKRPLSPYERLAWELASRLSPKSPEREKWLNKVWLEDISLRLPPGICGRVINSQIISTEYASTSYPSCSARIGTAGYPSCQQSKARTTAASQDKEEVIYPQEVHIYLAVKRKIQIGDKLAGRHGNKGIVSAILPQEDMPFLGDGSCIDMVLNPLGVPSRMNLGQIFECLLGLAGSQLGCNFRITPFDEIAGGEASRSLVFLKLYQCRLMYKQQWLFTPTFPGKSKLFDGRTGEPFENWVTVGQAYMLKLIHMVDHKIHARSTGPYSLFTRQPVRGRSRRGGQRLGEMEVWAVEGFGAAYTLQEFLTIKSDDLKARTALQKGFYKQNDVTFGKIHIAPGNPEAFKVLVSELQALCLHIQM